MRLDVSTGPDSQGDVLEGGRASKTATVAYLIDSLGMRVGDEKRTRTRLTPWPQPRVEHIKIFEDNRVRLLGKDSVRQMKTISTPDEVLLRNLSLPRGEGPTGRGARHRDLTRREPLPLLDSARPDRGSCGTYHATKVAKENLRSKDTRPRNREVLFCEEKPISAAIFCNHKHTAARLGRVAEKKKGTRPSTGRRARRAW